MGKGWEEIASEGRGKIRIHPEVPFVEAPGIYRNSKMVLNIMPLFRDGSHDRIPTALLSGAAALTDPTLFLQENFTEKREIWYYDISKPELLPETVENILSEPEEVYQSVVNGKRKASAILSWDSFAKKFLQTLEEENRNTSH